MPTQIVNYTLNETVSEVALLCGDKFFKDFPKNIYNQAVYRSQRSIAVEYQILERIWTHTITTDEAVEETEIEISPLNFDKEYKILVIHPDDTEATAYDDKVDHELNNDTDITEYYIRYATNKYVINYTNKEEGDILKIYYISHIAGLEDYEATDADGNANIIPVLPDKFYEEILKRAVSWIAKLGIASFGEEKKKKYIDLLKIYSSSKEKDMNLVKNDTWISIKPFQYL